MLVNWVNPDEVRESARVMVDEVRDGIHLKRLPSSKHHASYIMHHRDTIGSYEVEQSQFVAANASIINDLYW